MSAARVRELYEWHAKVEARGRSDLFAAYCEAAAQDAWTLDFVAAMPRLKWQPNVLIAAVRYLYGTPPTGAEFVELVHAHRDEIAATMAVRSTQTNEANRCATLLPVLARLPQPLALLEVGASAGLCLLPDRYAYDYGRARIEPTVAAAATPPVLSCAADPGTPLPERNVEVAWRAGLDLHPIDLADDAEVRWLEALVWPGQDDRLARLRAACAVAREDPPPLVAGDLLTDLPELAAQAPSDATLVVFHTVVIAYLRRDDRARFAETVRGLDAVWIANERPTVIPGIGEEVVASRPDDTSFLLCVDGEPTAWTDPHGAAISWRAAAS